MAHRGDFPTRRYTGEIMTNPAYGLERSSASSSSRTRIVYVDEQGHRVPDPHRGRDGDARRFDRAPFYDPRTDTVALGERRDQLAQRVSRELARHPDYQRRCYDPCAPRPPRHCQPCPPNPVPHPPPPPPPPPMVDLFSNSVVEGTPGSGCTTLVKCVVPSTTTLFVNRSGGIGQVEGVPALDPTNPSANSPLAVVSALHVTPGDTNQIAHYLMHGGTVWVDDQRERTRYWQEAIGYSRPLDSSKPMVSCSDPRTGVISHVPLRDAKLWFDDSHLTTPYQPGALPVTRLDLAGVGGTSCINIVGKDVPIALRMTYQMVVASIGNPDNEHLVARVTPYVSLVNRSSKALTNVTVRLLLDNDDLCSDLFRHDDARAARRVPAHCGTLQFRTSPMPPRQLAANRQDAITGAPPLQIAAQPAQELAASGRSRQTMASGINLGAHESVDLNALMTIAPRSVDVTLTQRLTDRIVIPPRPITDLRVHVEESLCNTHPCTTYELPPASIPRPAGIYTLTDSGTEIAKAKLRDATEIGDTVIVPAKEEMFRKVRSDQRSFTEDFISATPWQTVTPVPAVAGDVRVQQRQATYTMAANTTLTNFSTFNRKVTVVCDLGEACNQRPGDLKIVPGSVVAHIVGEPDPPFVFDAAAQTITVVVPVAPAPLGAPAQVQFVFQAERTEQQRTRQP